MKIVGLQKVTLLDYPGHIAASVFLGGCNFDCAYCHNRWMLDAVSAPEALSVDELLDWLGTRRELLDGVCISGGEPLLQPDLAALMRRIKVLGYRLKLDTNGSLPARLGALLAEGLVDYVAMDLKAPLDARYDRVAGCHVDLAQLRASMALLRASGLPYEFRTTVGPQLDEAALWDLARELQPHERWYLQPYIEVQALHGQPALSSGDLVTLASRLASLAPGVRVRGEE